MTAAENTIQIPHSLFLEIAAEAESQGKDLDDFIEECLEAGQRTILAENLSLAIEKLCEAAA